MCELDPSDVRVIKLLPSHIESGANEGMERPVKGDGH